MPKDDNELLMKNEQQALDYRLRNIAKQSGSGFWAHFTTFLAANVFFAVLNGLTSAGFPWFFFITAGWAVGLLAHLQSTINTRRKRKRFLFAEKKSGEQQYLIKKLHHAEARFKQHRNVYLSCGVFLAGTNAITSAGFPWFLIPMGGWAIGLFAHWSAYRAKRKYIIKELEARGISWKTLTEVETGEFVPLPVRMPVRNSGNFPDYYEEANALKQSILEEMKHNVELKSHWGSDLEMLLTRFTDQMHELSQMDRELAAAISTTDEKELKQELESLELRNRKATDTALQNEYGKSIAQYNHQLRTIEDLKNKQEIIRLRLKSALICIRQVKLDAARLKNMKSVAEPSSLKEIRQKSAELSSYLEDFNTGYREMEQDN